MRPLRKFFQITSTERFLILQTALLLSSIRLGLKFLPFQTLRRWLATLYPVATQPSSTITINQVIWSVEVISGRSPGGVKCLARALATQALLSKYGYAAQLCIGVTRNDAGRLEAHAWVERQGEVLIGGLPQLEQFIPLTALGIEE